MGRSFLNYVFTTIMLLLVAVSSTKANSLINNNLSNIRGINYVPSTSKNDIQTVEEYDPSLTEQEIGWAGAAGFNVARLFVNRLSWKYNSTHFFEVTDHFIATCATNNILPFFVILDSCFGDVNADISWITKKLYQNFTWIPGPGPSIIANESLWATEVDEYVASFVSRYASDDRILGWDCHNEPDFSVPNMLTFLNHTAALVQDIDMNTNHVVTFGMAYAGQQGLVQDMVRTLSFHSYDGGDGGNDLANIIASQQAIAANLSKAVFLSECMSRPSDMLTAVLPAVAGCFPTSNPVLPPTPIGFILWEFMLGVDQFNYNWTLPFQGLVYPAAAGGQLGGTWWSPDEEVLWYNFTHAGDGNGTTFSCPWTPIQNYSQVDDTDPRIEYSPVTDWTEWTGGGPRDGHLHYANVANATAVLTIGGGVEISILHKMGPDCGIVQILLAEAERGEEEKEKGEDDLGQGYTTSTTSSVTTTTTTITVDTYSPSVTWNQETVLGMSLNPGTNYTVTFTSTGEKNPASINTYVQLVGFNVYF